MTGSYSVKNVAPWSFCRWAQVEGILHECGKDMASRDDLHHWDNSHAKNAIIVGLCILKNKVRLVCDGTMPVATFQTKASGGVLSFQKLATKPSYAGRGVGSFCMDEIQREALLLGCGAIRCEVYDKSRHAIEFYTRKGFSVLGKRRTPKYTVLVMERALR